MEREHSALRFRHHRYPLKGRGSELESLGPAGKVEHLTNHYSNIHESHRVLTGNGVSRKFLIPSSRLGSH